jgi:4-hydroxybenzoate polyprenyltransferase
MKIKHSLRKILENIENTPQTLLGFLGAFTMLIVLRLSIEGALGLFAPSTFQVFFVEFSHTFLFFLFAFILFLPLLSWLTKESILRTVNTLLFGFFIILTPPIIDTLLFGHNGFWSFYEFDGFLGLILRYFTFFGDTPSIGITTGVRLEVLLVTLGSIVLIYTKTRSILRSLLGGILMYSLFFILGTFPSWITLMVQSFSPGFLEVNEISVARLFLTPDNILSQGSLDIRSVLGIKMSLWYALLILLSIAILFWQQRKDHFLALYHNARFPQVFYHGGLVSVGALLATHFEDLSLPSNHFSYLAFFLLILSAVFAWLTSVVANDFYDTHIDTQTNPTRPLITKVIDPSSYRDYGVIFCLTSLFFAALVSSQSLLLVLSYQVCAWIYSAPPFRLKRFPLIATLFAASASMLLLVAGYLSVSETHSLALLPTHLLLYLLVFLTLMLPLKDFKDIPGDAADGVYTIPVILGDVWGKRVLGSLLFIIFVLSPVILNALSLLPLALIIGSIGFWTIQNGTADQKSFFCYHRFSRLLFSLVFIYGLLATLGLYFGIFS